MRKFLLVFISLALSIGVHAQDNVKKAKNILNKVSKTYKGYKSIKATFTVTQEDPNSKTPTKINGTVWLKDKAFKIDVPGEEIVCDGSTIWNWQKEICEVKIQDYKPSSKDIQPSEIFNLHNRDFSYTWAEQVTEGGKKLDVIDLVPKTDKDKKEKNYSKIKLRIDVATNQIISCTIIMKSGVKTTYTLNSQSYNVAEIEGKSFFKMDPASKKDASTKQPCEVVDLRKKKQ